MPREAWAYGVPRASLSLGLLEDKGLGIARDGDIARVLRTLRTQRRQPRSLVKEECPEHERVGKVFLAGKNSMSKGPGE